MDECQNVINFGEFDTINVDDATECKMVKLTFVCLIVPCMNLGDCLHVQPYLT